MKKTKIILSIILLIIILSLIGFVGYGYYKKATMNVQNPIATMEVKDYGTVKIELYPDIAPETVANFVKLANNGYYDGLTFHRIIKDFMIQGGDKKGDGTGGVNLSALDTSIEKDSDKDKEYSIKGEFIANGVKNTLKHEEGVISMARSDYSQYSQSLAKKSYDSAGSQFFIVTKATASLDGKYASFGKVTEGLDVVHKIEGAEIKKSDDKENSSGEESTPVNPPVISQIRVETYGVDYGMPKTLEPFNISDYFSTNVQ
ncbi:MAG: peptidylprolyl isomerase [Clostridia bacterium]|nr:peptidylprolyl isomerase [Clostridia bacterium]